MLQHWSLILIAAGILGVGASMGLYAASDMVRVVAPSPDWLEKRSSINQWGARLMIVGAMLTLIGIVMAVGHWVYG